VKTQYPDGARRIHWIRSTVSTRIVNNWIICAQLTNLIPSVFAVLISVRETGRPNLPTDFIKSASRSVRDLVVAFTSLVKDLDKRKCAHLLRSSLALRHLCGASLHGTRILLLYIYCCYIYNNYGYYCYYVIVNIIRKFYQQIYI